MIGNALSNYAVNATVLARYRGRYAT